MEQTLTRIDSFNSDENPTSGEEKTFGSVVNIENREKEEERMEENIFEEDLNARTSSKQENGTFIESRPGAKPLLNRDLNLSSSIAISIMAGNENVFFLLQNECNEAGYSSLIIYCYCDILN